MHAADILTPSAKYNAAVPTPESVLGYKIGTAFTPYAELETYYQKLAAAAPERAKLQAYGKSVEGRTLYTLFISTPKNLEQLETFRQAWLKLADPRQTNPSEAQGIEAHTPALVWLSYNVHGNEASSSEAAMQVAYELTASEDQNVQAWLENSVIVIDPVLNPDGRDRYVTFYRQWAGVTPRADRFAAEHQERWPGGRVNHYLFDLNRDWAWQSQQETVARIATIRKWAPQVVVDFHEMDPTSTYFFPPPAKPILPMLDTLLGKWFETYGRANAAAFDKFHFPYYTHESYDFFYPSYGDIWPSLNGAVGMTYEQGGGGRAGMAYEVPDQQRTLTLRDRVSHHFVSSLATIDTSSKNREARLRDFYEFHRAALSPVQKGTRAYYIVPGRDPQRMAHLIDVLLKGGIEVKRAGADFEISDATDYWGERVRKRFAAGTYVVDLAQPASFLARALLEREFTPEAVFFYDVSSWSLPLLADVEAYSSGAASVPGNLQAVTEAPQTNGAVTGAEQPAGYVIPIEQTASLRLLSRLLAEGVKADVILKPVRLAGRQFSAGGIVVPVENNPGIAQRMQELARATDAEAFGITTLLSEEGVDLGSSRVRFLRKPKIAVLTDSPVSVTEYGSLWYLFEQRADIPFTPIRTEELRSVDLRNYNVLILPPDNGDGAGYSRAIDKALSARINEWVREGGLLIGIRGGAVWATKHKSGITSVTYRYVRQEDEEARIQEEKAAVTKEPTKEAEPAEKRESPAPTDATRKQTDLERKLTRYADRERQRRSEDIPGALLRVNLDTTHPLAFGMNDRVAVLDETAPILELSAKGENPGYFGKDNLKVSGFITPENERKVTNTAYMIRERVGRGSVVLFADTPVFRGFSDGTTRLLLNAIFFGNVIDPNIP